jgi:hypothetical protein
MTDAIRQLKSAMLEAERHRRRYLCLLSEIEARAIVLRDQDGAPLIDAEGCATDFSQTLDDVIDIAQHDTRSIQGLEGLLSRSTFNQSPKRNL